MSNRPQRAFRSSPLPYGGGYTIIKRVPNAYGMVYENIPARKQFISKACQEGKHGACLSAKCNCKCGHATAK